MRKILVNIFIFLAYHLRLWGFVYWLAASIHQRNVLAVFTFHRITDSKKSDKFYMGYEKGSDYRVFQGQIRAITRYFKVITLEEFLDIINGKKEFEKHLALLTFDDADSEFEKYVCPVLEKNGCSAVNFAPTDFIDTDKRFWHLRVSNIVYNANRDSWKPVIETSDQLPPDVARAVKGIDFNSEQTKEAGCRKLMRALSKLDHDRLDEMIDKWEKSTGAAYTLGIECHGWDDLRRLESRGVRIESHTASHRRLATLDREAIKKELIDSRKKLDEELKKSVRTLCYPAGSFNDLVIDEMAKSDYEAGFTSIDGSCAYPLDERDRYRIPRYGFYGDNKYRIHFFLGKIGLNAITSGKTD